MRERLRVGGDFRARPEREPAASRCARSLFAHCDSESPADESARNRAVRNAVSGATEGLEIRQMPSSLHGPARYRQQEMSTGTEVIDRIVEQNLGVYRASPSRLLEDVSQEAQVASDYRGR